MDREHAHTCSLKFIESSIDRYSDGCFCGPRDNLNGQLQNTGRDRNQPKVTRCRSHRYQSNECLSQSSTAVKNINLKDVIKRNCSSVEKLNAEAEVSNIRTGVSHEHAQKLRFMKWQTEASLSMLECTQQNMPQQTSMHKQEAGDSCNIYKFLPGVTVAGPSSVEKPTHTTPKERPTSSDRHRRQLINEKIRALQGFLPNPSLGGQASALDDIIDHVKYLQLQLKDLTRGKLVEQLPAHSLIFCEGYGHYIHEQMLNEPLEEMMGQMLMVNPTAATRLLESRGLFMVPISSVEESLD